MATRKYRMKRKSVSKKSVSKKSTRKMTGGGPKCPNCKSTNTYVVSAMRAAYKCNQCGKEFINQY